jgi:eukaryotic-like serine/threonine-protein kinase
MAEVFAIIFIFGVIPFGLPVSLRWMRYRHERRIKELQAGVGEPGEVKALMAAKSELEERVRNLESIVSSVDFELNAKLNRLANKQIALSVALPALPGSRTSSLELADTDHFVGGTLTAGRRLANRYVVERAIGQGGMGAVYLARDEQLGEQVALKVIGGMAALDPMAADRLRREASAARRISHPNVVRLHDIGESDGVLFLSMEYVPGSSLRELLARHGVLPAAHLRPFIQQIAEGLHAAHLAGVIHRDLKPANLLVDDHQRIKIIDFGLARLAHLEGMTATNMIVGTVEYMAPEQLRGGSLDARTDVYALGAVLYHALVGRPPFTADNPIAVGFAHCNDAVVPPSIARPGVDACWDGVVLRALAKDPNERWGTALELRDALPS